MHNPSAIRVFQSHLSDRSQYVFLNSNAFAVGTMRSGVPQDSILEPLQGYIFINDQPLYIRHKQKKKKNNNKKTTTKNNKKICLLMIHLLTQVGKLQRK